MDFECYKITWVEARLSLQLWHEKFTFQQYGYQHVWFYLVIYNLWRSDTATRTYIAVPFFFHCSIPFCEIALAIQASNLMDTVLGNKAAFLTHMNQSALIDHIESKLILCFVYRSTWLLLAYICVCQCNTVEAAQQSTGRLTGQHCWLEICLRQSQSESQIQCETQSAFWHLYIIDSIYDTANILPHPDHTQYYLIGFYLGFWSGGEVMVGVGRAGMHP